MKDVNEVIAEKKYPIMEIFDSIQGEGAMIGMPTTFIRFAGCNLQCPWCDTKDSWEHIDRNMTAIEIAAKCNRKMVVITGGEPCMYKIEELINVLKAKELFVCIETNGTMPTPENADWVVCSPKPPAYHISPECKYDELKYVVDDEFDVGVIPDVVKATVGSVWLQPQGYDMDNSAKKAYELVMDYEYLRMGIQMHKILNVK